VTSGDIGNCGQKAGLRVNSYCGWCGEAIEGADHRGCIEPLVGLAEIHEMGAFGAENVGVGARLRAAARVREFAAAITRDEDAA
jgi:hypothetical protein